MLDRHRVLQTDDFELSQHVHSLQALSLEPVHRKVRSSIIHSQASAFENPDFQLFHFKHSADLILDAGRDNPHYWLALPICCQPVRATPDRCPQKRTRLLRRTTRLASPGRGDPLRLSSGTEYLGLSLKHHTVANYAAQFFGDEALAPIVFAPHFDLSHAVNRAVGQMVVMLVEQEQFDAGVLLDARRMAAFVDAVVSALILFSPHSHSALLKNQNRAPAPRDVKRVIDYIRAYPERPTSLPDLVAIAGVPGRTLNGHFRAFTGLAPMAYLKRTRLGRVRRMLQAGEATSVTEAAMQSGFYHLGRLSGEYQRTFGELPSQTLAKSRLR